jgi:hypothetical protein
MLKIIIPFLIVFTSSAFAASDEDQVLKSIKADREVSSRLDYALQYFRDCTVESVSANADEHTFRVVYGCSRDADENASDMVEAVGLWHKKSQSVERVIISFGPCLDHSCGGV